MYLIMKCLNEQHSVARCIGDFHDEPWVEKIRVIDCGSSDFTVQELKQFPKVEVFHHFYDINYHDQEISHANMMLSYCPHGALYFSLDFDERMNQPLKDYLAKIDETNELPDEADLVHIPRRTVQVMRYPDSSFAILGKDKWPMESHQIGQFPDYQPRLMRKTPYLHWIQSPHRCIVGFKKNYNLSDHKCYIEHFEKDDSRDRDWIEKRWLKPIAVRKALGLPADIRECSPKLEYAEAADIDYWKDR